MTPHDYQGPTATMPGTTTGNRSVPVSTLTYTHSMQPPHPTFCKYILSVSELIYCFYFLIYV